MRPTLFLFFTPIDETWDSARNTSKSIKGPIYISKNQIIFKNEMYHSPQLCASWDQALEAADALADGEAEAHVPGHRDDNEAHFVSVFHTNR